MKLVLLFALASFAVANGQGGTSQGGYQGGNQGGYGGGNQGNGYTGQGQNQGNGYSGQGQNQGGGYGGQGQNQGGGWTTAPPLPNPPTNLASMCSYDQLKIDSNPCMSACWPAKQAGCGGPYGPANCANYYPCQNLENGPATTSAPSAPYDQSKNNDASACGEGTKMEDGKCVINYSGLKEMCYMASKNDWGWTCKSLSQCPTPSPFNN